MLNKKCSRCGRKIEKDYDFCPFCGSNIRKEEDERDFGFLGKDDFLSPDMGMKMPFGFNKLFNSLIKQLDKQFRELDKDLGKEINQKKKPGKISKGLSISISSATGDKPEIKIRGFGPGFNNLQLDEEPEKQEKTKKLPKSTLSEAKAKKLSKLPKEEALAKVRRLSNKIIYEIDLPDVKKLADIIINKLENSIEIKAFSKDKVYFKLLPINLPILDFKLEEEKLILELKAKE